MTAREFAEILMEHPDWQVKTYETYGGGERELMPAGMSEESIGSIIGTDDETKAWVIFLDDFLDEEDEDDRN